MSTTANSAPTSSPSPSTPPSSAEYAPVLTAVVDLAISGMTCAACVNRVEKKLNKHPHLAATVNLATEKAQVEVFSPKITPNQITEIIEKAGYGAKVIKHTAISAQGTAHTLLAADLSQIESATLTANQRHQQNLQRRLIVSFICSVPVVALSMYSPWQFINWQWLALCLTIPVALWAAYPFHRGAYLNILHGTTTMDTLVSLGVLTSFGYSLWALVATEAGSPGYQMYMTGLHHLKSHHPSIYLETTAMIVTFLLLGKLLEARSRHLAGDALHSLLTLGAKQVFILQKHTGAKVNKLLPITELAVGDIFRVQPGEKVATDGIVVTGNSALDCSLLTGESLPVPVHAGDKVTGATINTFGSLTVRAIHVGEDTVLAQMGKLLTAAQTQKIPIQHLVDKISAIFVPTVLLIALSTFLIRYFALQDTAELSLTTALTVLIVACPCALGLATPTALLVGSSKAAKHGILLHKPAVLESARFIDTILLDKTGTLTKGKMQVTEIQVINSAVFSSNSPYTSELALQIAAALEQGSEHPIGKAIVEHAQNLNLPLPTAQWHTAYTGSGISAEVTFAGLPAARYFIGSWKWVQRQLASATSNPATPNTAALSSPALPELSSLITKYQKTGATTVVLANEHEVIAVFAIQDVLRPESPQAIMELEKLGITAQIISGDAPLVAHSIGNKLGIVAHGDISPAQKVAFVQNLQAQRKQVAMVGDGVNDAAALAQANLSIALGSGTDVAKASSDITIVNSDVRAIAGAIRISRRTLRIIKENLWWAFAYNLLAIPLAVGGYIIPGIAAAAMASSSVLVVFNSLRLYRTNF